MRGVLERWKRHHNVNPVDPESTRRAQIYTRWYDHEIIRQLWTNQVEIAPGVFRSNHPPAKRLERLAAQGLNSVLTLRGHGGNAPYLLEKQTCERLGLTLHAIHFSARHAPKPASLLNLIEIFHKIERPFLMHCKSGADRSGLAAAIYLMVIEGQSLDQARRMLHISYMHFGFTRAGVMGRVLDAYAKTGVGLGFEDWVRTRYDPAAMT